MLGKGVWEGQQESQLSGGLPCRVRKTPEVTLRLVVQVLHMRVFCSP